MSRRMLAPLLACCLLGLPARGQEGDAEQKRAIAMILELMGTVQRDGTRPGKPVVGVNLSRTRVSDAGLAHLVGLATLTTLDLSDTRVSDAGLAHLAGLTTLTTLDLSSTQVSDAGLAHLKGLAGLTSLGLSGTQVTGAGIEEFLRALPKVTLKATVF